MFSKETKLGQNFHRTYETLQMYEFVSRFYMIKKLNANVNSCLKPVCHDVKSFLWDVRVQSFFEIEMTSGTWVYRGLYSSSNSWKHHTNIKLLGATMV